MPDIKTETATETEERASKSAFFMALAILLASLIIAVALLSQGERLESGVEERIAPSAITQPGAPVVPQDPDDIVLAPITAKDWVRGDRQATVTIIEFSDTECPFCKRFHPTLEKIVKDYDGQVNWVYKHAPLVGLHSKAPKEAEATECAGAEQGNDGFWNYLNALYEKTPSNNGLDAAELPKIAATLGLNVEKFNACLASGTYASKVSAHLKEAEAAGLQGTPYSVIVSGEKRIPVSGAVPEATLKAIIDPLLP